MNIVTGPPGGFNVQIRIFRVVLQWSVIVGSPGSIAILVYRGVEMKRLSFSIKSSIQNIYQYLRSLSDM